MSNIPREVGLEHFLNYMAEENTLSFHKSQTLADCIDDWLWDRRGGLGCCGGNYEIFLKTVALIVDAWHRDPTILDYRGNKEKGFAPIERRPTSAFGDDEKHAHSIFDRDAFTQAMFNWNELGGKFS